MDHTVWQDPDLAKTYLDGVRGAIPMAAEQIDVMLRLIAACEIPVRRFLDLGCGNGVLGAAIAAKYPAAEGVYVDFSEAMLASARVNLGGDAPARRIIEADYAEPDWAAVHDIFGPFDAIVSGFSIHHQPDERKRSLYAELFEMLSPGGIFINLEHVASATPRFGKIFDERFIDALVAHERATGGARSRQEITDTYYHRDDKGANILAPVETQCEWLRAIGYEHVDVPFKHYEIALFCGCKPK